MSGEARFVMNHGAGALYALDGDRRALDTLAREIAPMEGVSGMWTPSYASLGLPAAGRSSAGRRRHVRGRARFILSGDTAIGDEEYGAPKYLGTHGQRPTYPDNAAFFLAAGAGIARGRELRAIRSRDVAPTLTALLDLPPAPAEGRALTEILA